MVLLILDVVHGEIKGSQFAWIPMGNGIKKSEGTTFDIDLKG